MEQSVKMGHLFLIVLASTTLTHAQQSLRMIGWQTASLGELPYMALLNSLDSFCSATIISQSWVLTSAQCTEYEHPEAYLLMAGIVDFSALIEDAQTTDVTRIVRHPNYKYVHNETGMFTIFDVSLVQAKEPFKWTSFIKPINLACTVETKDVMAAGFGDRGLSLVLYRGQQILMFLPALKYLQIKSIMIPCEEISNWPSFLDHHVCLMYSDRDVKHMYMEDAGGPLIYKTQQVGVASIIYLVFQKSYFVVHTYISVPHVRQWIQENTNYSYSCDP